MTTKKKTTTTDPLAAAVAQAEAELAAGRQVLAHHRQQLAATRTALDEADDAATIGVLAKKVARSQNDVSTAVVEVQRLAAAVPNQDVSLATALVPMVTHVLGVPVLVSRVDLLQECFRRDS